MQMAQAVQDWLLLLQSNIVCTFWQPHFIIASYWFAGDSNSTVVFLFTCGLVKPSCSCTPDFFGLSPRASICLSKSSFLCGLSPILVCWTYSESHVVRPAVPLALGQQPIWSVCFLELSPSHWWRCWIEPNQWHNPVLLEIFLGVRGPIQMLQWPNATYRCVLFGRHRVFFKKKKSKTKKLWISGQHLDF